METSSLASITDAAIPSRSATRAFIIAWVMALMFYVLEYAARSAPAVMIPQLSEAFGRTAVGVSAILGSYYYTYSLTSLIAGLLLDRAGAKYAVAFGAAVLGIGCLLFTIANPIEGYIGRLLQGAGSSFAFTGAVYLASRGFSARSLATAIGITQCLGMLGGSAGQFLVGPLLSNGIDWRTFWLAFGIAGLVIAALLVMVTPANDHPAGGRSPTQLLAPYKVVLTNPQSYLCGIVAGLLFVPTTVGDMTWGVAFFQHDTFLDFGQSVTIISMVPLGWVFGCPLLGWLADRIGLRKPVIYLGGLVMIIAIGQVTWFPSLCPPAIGMFIAGVASGAAMIPYTVIKEANPDEVKGTATGAINFINFGISALIGPVFARTLGKTLSTTGSPALHFSLAGTFWMVTIALALVLTLFMEETGHARQGRR
ncbi:MAG: MFS transporter [Pseudolabrys sp.]|nr:MFS transporter [Pseudolabrys sp.]